MPTGPSSSQPSYLLSSQPNVTFTSIITTGDSVAGAPTPFVGVPDGIGAFDNGNGTATVLVNHEIGSTAGAIRAHGSQGAFVDQLVINTSTLQVISQRDLVTSAANVFTDGDGDGVWTAGTTAWERLCSGDLPAISAFFNSVTGLGTTDRIYMAGEETSPPFSPDSGRAFAFVATGADAGKAFELPRMGQISFENLLANPASGNQTIVMTTDDTGNGATTGGQVYMYVGTKQSTGNAVEKAGLANGALFGVHVNGIAGNDETPGLVLPGDTATFTMAALPNQSNRTGLQMQADSEAAGVTEFLRPEDGAWDPSHPNWFYFVTTASFTGPSRLWRMEFNDLNNPTAGGTIRMLLTGTEGQRMLDNMAVAADGKVLLQEDVGNQAFLGRVLSYDPVTDSLTTLGIHDATRFVAGGANFQTQDEESSGVVDVTSIFGNAGRQAFLLDTQAHNPLASPLVEGGQLQIMYIDKTPADFNGDAKSDILWRNVNGTTNLYQMNGRTVLDSGNISQQAGNEWQIQDKNDFNADGMADILWRNVNGTTNLYQMNGRTVVDTGNISIQSDNNWTIRGTDDFNADGRADILFRHTNGTTNLYQMNGRTVVDTGNISQQVGNDWTIQDTADFNGDGFSDILWRHTNGTTNIYTMNGRTVVESGNVSAQVNNAWKVQGTGDFNGDGKEDILWRDDNGTTNIHLMNGRTVLNSGNISAQPDNAWKVQDVKDYNGDNLSDILWRNDNGTTSVYLMNGLTVQESGNISQQAANDWLIV